MASSTEYLSKTTHEEANEAKEEAVFHLAANLCNSTMLSLTLKAVFELDVLEIIAAAGPDTCLSAEEIASQIKTSNPDAPEVLDRMLRLLACNKVVKCDVVAGEEGKTRRRYGMGLVGEFFTKNEDGVSLAPLLLMNHSRIRSEPLSNLKYAVLDGSIPFVKTNGVTMYEYHSKDATFTEEFNIAMFNHTTLLMKKMLEAYKGFESLKVLVDVGGGLCVTLGIILSKYPHIKGINFDLPFVVSQAPAIPGVEHVGGDMFDSVPTGDAIFMKWILHNWSDEHCVKLLKNCWNALPENGKVIILERLIPDTPEDTNQAKNCFQADLVMLAHLGGKERTEKEYECLAKMSGFSGFKVVCGVYGLYVMELYK
ncbi:hypothetical protein J5N97_024056 [Dioscorea zingiberensis]|uniref:Uncharacterized protein n=1 Tax=Dioscorea zingiberensis TaxID=325984 RepID=A0A9D5C6S1_9LILI|nr:hypothetical protein J5N97_024056 [Dioscorea zingiberensis]